MKLYFTPNKIVLSFLNKLFQGGKKEKLEQALNNLFMAKKNNLTLLKLIKAVELLKTDIDILSVKKRGKIYKIPTGVSKKRSLKISLKFLKSGIDRRKESTLPKKILHEISDIVRLKKCHSLNLKNEMYQSALFNRAFIHFRWR